MKPKKVLVIGVEPPCPRCALLGEMVDWIIARHAMDCTVQHISFTQAEARRIAHALGLEAGTAKHVIQKTNITVDMDAVYALMDTPPPHDLAAQARDPMARKWSPQLDRALSGCQQAARDEGILMTPVLVVDGRVVHEGSVPTVQQIEMWLKVYARRQETIGPC